MQLLSCDNSRPKRKFCARFAQGLAGHRFRSAVNLENDAAWTHVEDVALYIPLSAPMPTSAAFCVNGRSGNIRVQIFADFPPARESARRAASS